MSGFSRSKEQLITGLPRNTVHVENPQVPFSCLPFRLNSQLFQPFEHCVKSLFLLVSESEQHIILQKILDRVKDMRYRMPHFHQQKKWPVGLTKEILPSHPLVSECQTSKLKMNPLVLQTISLLPHNHLDISCVLITF